jgi:pimeloyl-ACP methyl ester carboxylesterase
VLYGISYGTRLALTVMRDHADGIAAAVLDSVWPPEVGVGIDDAAAFMATLGRIADACRADAACNTRYPDVVGAFASSIKRLRRAPVEIAVPGTGGAKTLYVLYDPTLFVDTLYFAMYWWDTVKAIPKAVDGFARSDFDAFVGLARDYIDDPQYEAFAHGTATAINCNDNLAADAAVDWDTQAAAYPYLREWIEDFNDDTFCDGWALDAARRGTATPTVSDIPTLLLAGRLDVATPAEYARMTAARLSASHLFVFPAMSHDIIDSHECATELVAAFLDDPASRPAPDCFDAGETLRFGGN